MQKIYKIVVVLLTFFVTFNQTQAQVANYYAECQADVKAISDKQVLLEKIEIPKSSVAINVSANIYVSYRSGNSQKFWTNLAIATAGIAVSTQVGGSSTPVTTGDSRTQSSSISPAIPLGVSAALIPGIWKNRPRGVPQAGLYVQHRDLEGKLTQSWEQAISSEAKNSAELLTVAIDKPLSEGTLEVYLQNGSKNEVFYWGLQTVKNLVVDAQLEKLALPPKPKKPINENINCPWGWFDDGWGGCIDPDTYWSTYAGHSSTLIDGVTVTAPGNGGSGNGGWNGSTPSGGDGSGGSGGSGSGNGNGSGNTNTQPEEDREEYKLGSLNWTAITKGWQIISNETGYVKRSRRNPTWTVYQDLRHESLRLHGDFLGQISFSLIRPPHTNHSEFNASIGLYINVSEQTPTWWGGTLNSVDDYERFASWSANQIASH